MFVKSRKFLVRWVWIWLGLAGFVAAKEAPESSGKTEPLPILVTVFYATNGDPKAAGQKATKIEKDTANRLRREERLRFTYYRKLGEDIQPLQRSDDSWARPLKPSDEIIVRFEAQERPKKNSALLDLELWLGGKKAVKTYARVGENKPLYMLGPVWRGGRLIIAITLAKTAKNVK